MIGYAATETTTRARVRRWLPGAGDASVDFLWVLLALTLVRGVIYAVLNPPFSSPDERAHFEYVAHLATFGESGPRGAEGSQPVPYYALMVPAYWLTAGAAREMQGLAIRLASIPFLLGVVVFTWLAARRMAPGKPLVAVIAAAFVGLHPQLAYIGGSANNDNAVNFMGAALTFLVVCLLSENTPRWAYPATAVALGAALMTKGQILPMMALALLVVLGRAACSGERRVRSALLIGTGALALVLAFSQGTPEGARIMREASDTLTVVGDLPRPGKIADQSQTDPFQYLFASFWSAFMGDTVRPWAVWYTGPTAVVVLAAAGYALPLSMRIQSRQAVQMLPALIRAVLVSAVVGAFATSYLRYLYSFNVDSFPYNHETILQGRFLFVAMVPLALLVAEGLDLLVPQRAKRVSTAAMVVMLAAFEVVSLLALLMGGYSWSIVG